MNVSAFEQPVSRADKCPVEILLHLDHNPCRTRMRNIGFPVEGASFDEFGKTLLAITVKFPAKHDGSEHVLSKLDIRKRADSQPKRISGDAAI
jgi:hypothetical protein